MSNLDPTTPTALVTGGSRGIGRAVALTLARDGYQVILTYVSRPEEADKTVAEIEAAGGRALALPLNVGDGEAVVAFFAEHIKGKVDLAVLVNNAGITKDGFLVRMKDDDFDRVITINLRGAFICTREAAKIMTKARRGRIVNISSVVGQMGNAGQANYSAAKAGLLGLTKSCANELAARQITVKAVAPGFIESAWAPPRRSPTPWPSWLRTRLPTSPARCWPSTAACTAKTAAAHAAAPATGKHKASWRITMSEVAAKVTKIIVDQLGVNAEEVKPEASFVEDLGADSLDLTELIMAMEEEFDIEIADDDAQKILKVQDAISYIESKQG